MIIEISLASSNGKPHEEAYRTNVSTVQTVEKQNCAWYSLGHSHTENEDGTFSRTFTNSTWVMEVESLEAFIKKENDYSCIVSYNEENDRFRVKIYDDYVE